MRVFGSSLTIPSKKIAQECIELNEGLRRDLVQMSLENSVLEACLNPQVSDHLY